MEPQTIGRLLLLAGAILLAAGGYLVLGGKLPPLGRLPGDFVVERPNVRLYIPLATSIIVSVAVSLLIWGVSRILKK